MFTIDFIPSVSYYWLVNNYEFYRKPYCKSKTSVLTNDWTDISNWYFEPDKMILKWFGNPCLLSTLPLGSLGPFRTLTTSMPEIRCGTWWHCQLQYAPNQRYGRGHVRPQIRTRSVKTMYPPEWPCGPGPNEKYSCHHHYHWQWSIRVKLIRETRTWTAPYHRLGLVP